MNKTNKPPDYWLLVIVFTLLTLGLVMVFSASSVTAAGTAECGYDPYFFLKRQAVWALVSVFVMSVAMRIDLEKLRGWSLPLVLASVAGLALVLEKHVGIVVNGARRWIAIGPFGFQPSEFAKFALVLYLADCLARRGSKIQQFTRIIPLCIIFGVIVLLVNFEPDLGTALVIAAAFMGVLFMSGARFSHLAGMVSLGLVAVIGQICKDQYKRERILVFLNPFGDPGDKGYQIVQSLIGLGSGGVWGLGLGESRQKFFYLPEQHTDFIFAIVGEELGLIGTLAVLFLFLMLLYRGLRVAVRSRDNYMALLAAGLSFTIAFQAFLNIGVVSAALPLTGIPLPFISYGGTSLLITMGAVGLLVNVSSRRKERREESEEIAAPPTETESLARKFQDMGYGLVPATRLRRRARR
ncbi:MAG: putative lipid II flippase FtsW [Proteobacteria bacterium]|nr:putative lipid II flippase FtsW [Pseudomonadota bacterium]